MRLREDYERKDKLLAYTSLGEECLRILWEQGTGPSVQGVVDGGRQVAQLLHTVTAVRTKIKQCHFCSLVAESMRPMIVIATCRSAFSIAAEFLVFFL